MESKWKEFYKRRLNDSYLNHLSSHYYLFIEEIVGKLDSDSSLIEMGCGMGNITKLIHRRMSEVNSICVDRDRDMLKLTELNSDDRTQIFKHDILDEFGGRFDLIHSHGVLEHLPIEGISATIRNQLKMSSNLVHYVPTKAYLGKSFGDEKLMSVDEWVKLVSPTRVIAFNNDKDLILIWEDELCAV